MEIRDNENTWVPTKIKIRVCVPRSKHLGAKIKIPRYQASAMGLGVVQGTSNAKRAGHGQHLQEYFGAKIAHKYLSPTSLPPPPPPEAPRPLAMESISSKNRMQGDAARALLNRPRMLASLSPNHMDSSSGPAVVATVQCVEANLKKTMIYRGVVVVMMLSVACLHISPSSNVTSPLANRT